MPRREGAGRGTEAGGERAQAPLLFCPQRSLSPTEEAFSYGYNQRAAAVRASKRTCGEVE